MDGFKPAARKYPTIEKSGVRVRKRTEAPALVSHILIRQARGGHPPQHLREAASKLQTQIRLLLTTVPFERMKTREKYHYESRSEHRYAECEGRNERKEKL
jgi:hypothetical protein